MTKGITFLSNPKFFTSRMSHEILLCNTEQSKKKKLDGITVRKRLDEEISEQII